MLEECGRVVAVEEGYAWVETQRKSACDACSVKKGCGTGALSSVLGQRSSRIRALNRINARVNEEVIVGLDEDALVKGSFAVYAVPLLTMLLSALVGEAVGSEWGIEADLLVAAFGIMGLLLGFAWVRGHSRKVAADPRYQPVILRHSEHIAVMAEQ